MRKYSVPWISCAAVLLLGVMVCQSFADSKGKAAANFFVAEDGDDAWSGTLAASNAGKTDGPFATLSRARERLGEYHLLDARERTLTRLFEISPWIDEERMAATRPIRFNAREMARSSRPGRIGSGSASL